VIPEEKTESLFSRQGHKRERLVAGKIRCKYVFIYTQFKQEVQNDGFDRLYFENKNDMFGFIECKH